MTIIHQTIKHPNGCFIYYAINWRHIADVFLTADVSYVDNYKLMEIVRNFNLSNNLLIINQIYVIVLIMSTNPNFKSSDVLAAPAFYVREVSDGYIGLATDVLRVAISNSSDARVYYENSHKYETYGAITLGNELVGMAAVHYSYLDGMVEAELKHLATIPRYQNGYGIGSSLIGAVESDAKVRGAEKLTLTAYSDAWDFYTKKGYSNPSQFYKPMKFEKDLRDSN